MEMVRLKNSSNFYLNDGMLDKASESDRKTYIDVAKGILIICVVIGHVINFEYMFTRIIKTFIYTFHMPAFFIISGILTNGKNLENQTILGFAKRKIKRLLIPYIFFEVVGGMLQIFLYGVGNVNFWGILYGILTMHCHIGADWFLPTLFFAEMIFFVVVKNVKKKMMPIIVIAFFMTAFMSPELNYGIAVIRRILIAFGFIEIGFLYKQVFVHKSLVGLGISFVLILWVAYSNGVVDLSIRTFNNPSLYLIGGIVGAYFILDVSQYLFGWLEKILAYLGQDSLVIMGSHQHVVLVVNRICGSVYSLNVQMIVLLLVAIYECSLLAIHSVLHNRTPQIIRERENDG